MSQYGFWESYSRSISLVSVLGLVIIFALGGYDLLKLVRPELTLNAALHEKYKTNESYTEFGAFHKNLPQEQITRQRIANYEKLLRMERRNAKQRLVKTGFALFIIILLNVLFVLLSRWRRKRTHQRT